MENADAATERDTETKMKNKMDKSITVRLDEKMNNEIDRLMCEAGNGNRSEFVRELIRDGLNYRNLPKPYLSGKLQLALLLELDKRAQVPNFGEDDKVTYEDSGIEKIRKMRNMRLKGAISPGYFGLILATLFLIMLAYALTGTCGN